MFPADIYLLKINHRNTRASCEICSKLVVLMSLLLTLNRFHTLTKCFYYWLWIGKCPSCVCLWLRFHHHHLTPTFFPNVFLFSSSLTSNSFTTNSWIFSGSVSTIQLILPSLLHPQPLRRGSDTLDNLACFSM